MKVRWLAFVIIAVCFGLIFFIGRGIPSELAPMEDRSQFRLQVTAPEGTSFDYMDKYIDKLSQFMIDSVPESKNCAERYSPGFCGAGAVNTGFVRVSLVDPKDRKRSQQEIVIWSTVIFQKFPEGRAFAIQEQTISVNRRGGQPVNLLFKIMILIRSQRCFRNFWKKQSKSPVFQGVDADLKFNKPELRINIDRLKGK